ncbi:hypothetical protein ONE63_006067 [Megalurothrips usitatus]|uniref:Uncharacterized protein n=1 Tax=Megalurothrips usitatus TaxID=439358 RepID=A0AAV7XS69_9NEOP|nr:hypothetical protein ONE63_006067 [Megalurothrips usitatus]
MDPVSMSEISFSRGYGPVRADIFFPSSTLSGVSDVHDITYVQCAGDATLAFRTHHKSVVQQGSYNLTGNFATVFATGKGAAHIQLMDVTIQHSLRWRSAHDGFRVRDYRGTVMPGHMKVHYSNLRSATRDVTPAECQQSQLNVDVNKYFNDNWRTLYEAISPSVDYTFSAVFRDYMDALLQAVGPEIQAACGDADP